jgi:hypothetical protein
MRIEPWRWVRRPERIAARCDQIFSGHWDQDECQLPDDRIPLPHRNARSVVFFLEF